MKEKPDYRAIGRALAASFLSATEAAERFKLAVAQSQRRVNHDRFDAPHRRR